ncbi:MAG: hypothetical protein U1E65_01170 [Myxococcota bacterium]
MSMALRPTFSLELTRSSREILSQLNERLPKAQVEMTRARVPGGGNESAQGPKDHDHFILTVPAAELHFWSPWLSVEVEPRGAGAHVFGRFSPHPSVWTAFLFGYLLLTVVAFFSLVFALGMAMSGGTPWTAAIAGGAALMMVLMWWASQVGQRLAHAQMESLRGILDRALA